MTTLILLAGYITAYFVFTEKLHIATTISGGKTTIVEVIRECRFGWMTKVFLPLAKAESLYEGMEVELISESPP